MITVAGEALMDVLIAPSGDVTAHPGGAPFNVARMIARLGGDSQFLGRLSDDGFGRRLRAALERQHVRLVVPAPARAPTALAVAELDDAGVADYRFYLEGTAASQLAAADIPPGLLGPGDTIVAGGLGIVIEPTASSLLALLARAPSGATVLLDPNCRPNAVDDPERYRAKVGRFLSHCNVVKVSADDLGFLDPGAGVRGAARALATSGPSAVLVTDGAAPVAVHTAAAEHSVPVPQVSIVDTVGAGDAFVAGFLTWWSGHDLTAGDLTDPGALLQATAAAVQVAAAACTVRGANLPAGFSWAMEGRMPGQPGPGGPGQPGPGEQGQPGPGEQGQPGPGEQGQPGPGEPGR